MQKKSASKKKKNNDGSTEYSGAGGHSEKLSPHKGMRDLDSTKDNNISIFHAIGKFLYNKRYDPTKKEAR